MSFQTSNDDEKIPPTNSSSFSNNSPVEDENKIIINKQKDKEVAIIKKFYKNDVSNHKGSDPFAPTTFGSLSITSCKKESVKDANLTGVTRTEPSNDLDFVYYAKAIRWLECEGYIDTGFRKKFLTWYMLSASAEEVSIVKGFVDTMMKDPASLAGQLLDTFSKVLKNKSYEMSKTLYPSPFSFI